MISFNRICVAGAVVSAAAAVLMASGCNVAGASGLRRAAEVRVATTLESGTPKMIISGPARLLHVNVQGHQSVRIYSVKRDANGAVSCAAAARTAVTPLRQGVSNELNLHVAEDEAVCLASDAADAPRTDVSWHARRGAAVPVEILHASND